MVSGQKVVTLALITQIEELKRHHTVILLLLLHGAEVMLEQG